MKKLDLDLIKEPNTFEVLDENKKIISKDCEKFLNKDIELKKGHQAVFYTINLCEDVYFYECDEPMTILTAGCPSWETLDFLKSKGLTTYGSFMLYCKLCDECAAEIEAIAKNNDYVRPEKTECYYCKGGKNV